MERVGTLINKLKEQYDQQQNADKLLLTAQLLLAELVHQSPTINEGKVAVTMPNIYIKANNADAEIKHDEQISKEPEVVSAELQTEKVQEELPFFPEIKHHKHIKKEEQSGWLFDPFNTVPTLAHQDIIEKPINAEEENTAEKLVFELKDTLVAEDEKSLNDKLKEEKTEVVEILKSSPVKDLKKAIGINDQYLFINELFRGDENMYERSIKTINTFSIFAEAEYWIQRELKVKLGWDENSEAVQHFNQLVKRRFS